MQLIKQNVVALSVCFVQIQLDLIEVYAFVKCDSGLHGRKEGGC